MSALWCAIMPIWKGNMDDHKTQEGALLRKVRELLEHTTIPTLEIYKATGVMPNQQWAIKRGGTKNPSVNTVEALYVFLTGKQLEL